MDNELRWSAELLVGVPSIDLGHRGLAALIDAIQRAVSRGEDSREVQALLLSLVKDTRAHFKVEDDLMQASAFPGRTAHEAEHVRLLERVLRLARQKSPLTAADASALEKWLLCHIRERDVALGQYLQGLASR